MALYIGIFCGCGRTLELASTKVKAWNRFSLGVDTWGVDFGLLDAQGKLIGNPVNYRDSRTDGMMARVFETVPREQVYEQTGIQFMSINTLYQLQSLVEGQSPQLDIAHTFLTAPDLLNYWLTGTKVCEFSNTTTTQMFNPRSGTWTTEMLDKLGIPTHIFPEIVQPRHANRRLSMYRGHCSGLSRYGQRRGLPCPPKRPTMPIFSSGTWSLIGLEVNQPIISPEALAINATNEGGVYGTYRLLCNVMGLWIIQQCRATWQAQGLDYSYADLITLAEATPSLRSLIDPNDHIFFAPGNHPQHVQDWCAAHNQLVPETPGAIVRCVLESLALKYQEVLSNLLSISNRQAEVIHIVGGGTQNELLNQMTANATGLTVVTGPVEATVIGNAIVQLNTLGEIANLHEARQIVANSSTLRHYQPKDVADWQDAYGRYIALKRYHLSSIKLGLKRSPANRWRRRDN